MFCGKCGAECKDGATFCGSCGNPLSAQSSGFTPADRFAAPGNVGDTPAFDPSSIAEQPFGAEPAPVYAGGPSTYTPPKKKGLGKGALIGIIAGGGVILVGLIVFLVYWFAIRNTPVNRYRRIEKDSISSMVSSFENVYQYGGSSGMDYEVTVTLGSRAQQMLEQSAGIGMNWLDSVGLSGHVESGDDAMSYSAVVNVNDTEIISANAILDLAEGYVYLQVPEVLSDYLGMDMEELGMSSRDLEQLSMAMEAMPDQEQVSDVLTRYLELVVDHIDEVDRDSGKLKAGGVSNEYTTLTVVLDEDALTDIALAVLDELEDDGDVRDILIAMGDAGLVGYSMDGEDYYDEFMDEVADARERIEDDGLDMGGEEITMTLYVDGNEVRGRVIEIGDQITISYKCPEEGNEYGVEFTVEQYGSTMFTLSGSGEGDTGSFTLNVSGIDAVYIDAEDFDRDALKDGNLKGTFTLTFNSLIVRELGSMFEGAELVVTADTSDDEITLGVEVSANGGFLGALDLHTVKTKGSSIKIPDDYLTEREWTREVDVSDLLSEIGSRLRDAGASSQLVSMLDMLPMILDLN